MSGQIWSVLCTCCQAAGSCYTIPLYYMCSQATILNLLRGIFKSFISILSREYGGGGVVEMQIAKFTCKADNVDEKSLHCSSKAISLAITFMSSPIKEFMFSTYEWRHRASISRHAWWGQTKHTQIAFSNLYEI